MKRASLALFVLAGVVAMAWPLTSAIGTSMAAFDQLALRPAACPSDPAAAAPGDDPGDELALPPGHPALDRLLPPGHPPISADGLPPGHPPVGRGLPPGHPPVPSGHGFAPPIDTFGEPVLLSI